MAKNITLSVPDDLVEEMEKLTEVNWSAVARNAFLTYIESRKEPDISEIVEKMSKQKNEMHKTGYAKAIQILKENSFETIEAIYDNYRQRKTVLRREKLRNAQTPVQAKSARTLSEKERAELLSGLLHDMKLLDAQGNEYFKRGVWDCFIKVQKKLIAEDEIE